jgi:hypothetical protein
MLVPSSPGEELFMQNNLQEQSLTALRNINMGLGRGREKLGGV